MVRSRSYAAQAFLRSPTGLSLRGLGDGPPPADLQRHLPPPHVRDEVVASFAKLGFRAFADAMGLTVSIEAPAALFYDVFGVDEARLNAVKAVDTLSLPVPAELRGRVDDILLLPAPELFR